MLDEALAHRSSGRRNYERLEFLGDSLLNFVVAEALFRLEPTLDEGALSRLRASFVKGETLAAIGREVDLGSCLQLGTGELRSGGFERDSILADALEAVIGAIFLDGGYARARAVVLALFDDRLERRPDVETLKDPKTRLQELLQGRGLPRPSYEVASQQGAAHDPTITVCCRLEEPATSRSATASSRRKAEQAAAAALLDAADEWLATLDR